MKLLLFASGANDTAKRIKSMIKALAPRGETETCRTINSIAKRLRKQIGDITVVVILAVTKEELLEILCLRELLSDLRIVLILPDRDHSSVVKGLRLRPRYIGYADTDLSDVSTVLKKMLELYSCN